MSTAVLPTFPATAYPVTRQPMWDTTVQTSVAGDETRIALRPYPRYQWDIPINLLRASAALHELQDLMGFYNARQGSFDTFLYQDADDNSVTGQAIATGDGVTQNFQLIRTFGGFIEPVLAPDTVGTINIYLNGVLQNSGYTVNGWGVANPGYLNFTVAPSNTVAITADFGFYWPCRFVDDKLPLNLFMSQFYECKKLSFMSVFN